MLTTNLAGKEILDKYRDFCRVVDTGYSRAVIHDLDGVGALRALKRSAPRPSEYSCAETFGKDWMVYHYLRKYPGLPGSRLKDRKSEALRSWSAAEAKCRATNGRVLAFEMGYSAPLEEIICLKNQVSVAAVILAAQRKISRVLGPFNEKLAQEECRWSNGATFEHKRGTPRTIKMTDRISVTRSALPTLRKVLSRDIHWSAAVLGTSPAGYCSLLDGCFEIVEGNRHQTVPKTAYVERSIGIEPTGNGFLQQGAGRFIRKRLKRVGVNLDDQSLSQRRAAEAAFESLSTLDLESASDTISRRLVHLMLPIRWFRYLDSLRSPITRLEDGRKVLLEKFSSMGNAFTFELESLIFWALARSVAELTAGEDRSHFVTVYGDDIIVPRESACALHRVLSHCGFQLNDQKSFFNGPFFESCGKHYFLGKDVTPAIQDSEVQSLSEVIRYYNRVVRWNVRMTGRLFSKESSQLIKRIQYGSHRMMYSDEGDECFIVPLDEAADLRYCPNRGYLLDAVLEVIPLGEMPRHDAAYAYKLRRPSTSNESPKGYPMVAGRGNVRRMKIWRSGDIYTPLEA